MSEEKRPLIVFDGHKWFVRGLLAIEHDIDSDHKVYRCDRHLGGPFDSVAEAAAFVSPPNPPGEAALREFVEKFFTTVLSCHEKFMAQTFPSLGTPFREYVRLEFGKFTAELSRLVRPARPASWVRGFLEDIVLDSRSWAKQNVSAEEVVSYFERKADVLTTEITRHLSAQPFPSEVVEAAKRLEYFADSWLENTDSEECDDVDLKHWRDAKLVARAILSGGALCGGCGRSRKSVKYVLKSSIDKQAIPAALRAAMEELREYANTATHTPSVAVRWSEIVQPIIQRIVSLLPAPEPRSDREVTDIQKQGAIRANGEQPK